VEASGMSELPYMPLWIGDYLSDTQMLNMEQSGSLLHLLMAMWGNGGWLRNDPKKLARICRMTPRRWERVLAPALNQFLVTVDLEEGPIIQNKRLTVELQKTLKNRTQKQNAAKAKWLKTKQVNGAAASAISYPYPDEDRGLQEKCRR
jgi:uncharacterized protein YdaU (DUF1376 family)